MTVNIKGKEYKTVAERIEDSKGEVISVKTDIVNIDNNSVIIKAEVTLKDNRVFTGIAREFRDDPNSFVNKTSFVENAETSAVGRALAFAGYAGGEICSADEVKMSINRGEENDYYKNATTKMCKCGNIIKGSYQKCYTCNMKNKEQNKNTPDMNVSEELNLNEHYDSNWNNGI